MTHRPVLSYAAQFGKVGFASEVKWLPQVGTQNTLKGDYVWFKNRFDMGWNALQLLRFR